MYKTLSFSKSLPEPRGFGLKKYKPLRRLCLFRLIVSELNRILLRHREYPVGQHQPRFGGYFFLALSAAFPIARQPHQRLPIPFEQPAEDARAYAARQSLDRLGITQSQLAATILGDSKHLDQLLKLTYQLRTNKKATKSPSWGCK